VGILISKLLTLYGDSKPAKVTVTQTQSKEGNTSSSELFDLKILIAFGYMQQEAGAGGRTPLG